MNPANTRINSANSRPKELLDGRDRAPLSLEFPLDQRPPPLIASPVKNTVDAIILTKESPESIFRSWLLHYGINLVAHAVLLERAAEALTGRRSRQSFMESLQGPSPLHYEYNEGKPLIGSLRQLAREFYVPPCAFQSSKTFKRERDHPIVFFSVDLANLFFERAKDSKSRATFGGMDTYTRNIKTLDDILRWETIKTGLRFVAEGYGKAIEAYTRDLAEKVAGSPLGAASLARHYQALIEFYSARTRDLMERHGTRRSSKMNTC